MAQAVTDIHKKLLVAAVLGDWKPTDVHRLFLDGLDFSDDDEHELSTLEDPDFDTVVRVVRPDEIIIHAFDWSPDGSKQHTVTIKVEDFEF